MQTDRHHLRIPGRRLSAQLVDVALRQSPSTRAAWQTARAAAASYGAARGAYYPSVAAFGGGGYGDSPGTTALVGGFGYVGATLDYLLLDFGGRDASVEMARQALFAAGWGANRAATYGVDEKDLGQFYANRTILKREVVPENVADAVYVLTGPELSRTTGLHVPVDSGVAAAFLR